MTDERAKYDRVLLAVMRVLAEAGDERGAVCDVLGTLCRTLGWRLAMFWRERDGLLQCEEVWPSSDDALAEFEAASRASSFARGEGLPGSVWQTGAPVFIEDFSESARFPRAYQAAHAGLKGAAAFPVKVDGAVVGVIEVHSDRRLLPDASLERAMTDVSAQLGQFVRRHWAEQELRAREEQYRALVATAGDAIVTMNEHGQVLSFNNAAERLFGWTAAEMIGRKLTHLMPERFRGSHEAGVARYLRTKQRNIRWDGIELPGLRRDGTEVPLEISFGEYTHRDTRIFTGVLRDISERLQHQQAMEDAQEELEQTIEALRQRSEEAESASRAKSEFLAAMSHELRTPLQAVIGFAGLLTDEITGPINDAQREQLGRIQTSATHLLDLIDQLLDISRSEAGTLRITPVAVNVCAEVRETIALIQPMADARSLSVLLTSCPDSELRDVEVDPSRFRQILLNLLTNAVKFTDNGEIGVTVASAGPDRFRVEVRDGGIGMTPEQLSHVFKPFYQAEGALAHRASGMGLGLAISYRLAEAMNGTLTATSELGAGSTFTLELPRQVNLPAD
jgi:PAS domain S-box-containing protein